MLAECGEVVHVVSQLWYGATREMEQLCGGRLVVHRVPLDEPVPTRWQAKQADVAASILNAFRRSETPAETFGWQASLLAEVLVEREAIDVVEAQDFEAPLYYFQLRRALGLGPARRPPCFVHLHSPTEYIFRHNEWDIGRPDYLPQRRLEEYSIAAADALLSPSRHLAQQIETQFGLRAGSVHVVPYPMGEFPYLERTAQIWAEGTVCYVGRLELRKGVVEYVDAAIDVARRHPALRFDFVGSDTPISGGDGATVGEYLRARIPPELRASFRFYGAQSRARLSRLLAAACIAVVPSRWENFPNACIEMMSSGLPVVAPRVGGMAEMLDDGQTGWLAASVRSEDLRVALQRALATPPAEREAMGRAAAATVRRLCDNATIVDRQLSFRRSLVVTGPERSLRVSPVLPGAGGHTNRSLRPPTSELNEHEAGTDRAGLGLVVIAVDGSASLDDCVAAVTRQTQPPVAVVLVVDEARSEVMRAAARRARMAGWQVIDDPSASVTAARNVGTRTLLGGRGAPLGIAFIDASCRLEPTFVEACETTLRSCPEVGIVSSWTRLNAEMGTTLIRPCPAFPYQWLRNDAATCSALRTTALLRAGLLCPELDGKLASWDLVNTVMAAGWAAITYPAVLADEGDAARAMAAPSDERMRQALLARFPDLVARDASALVLLRDAMRAPAGVAGLGRGDVPVVAQVLAPGDIVHASLARKIQIARRALREPVNALRWLAWHGRRSLVRGGARLRRWPSRAAP